MPFHMRDSETDGLVRQLARFKGLGLTETIKDAVRQALAQENAKVPFRDRIADLRREVLAQPPTGLEADKAFFDSLSGEP